MPWPSSALRAGGWTTGAEMSSSTYEWVSFLARNCTHSGQVQAGETMDMCLHVTEPPTLTTAGWQPSGPSVELYEGWNPVGHPSQTARAVTEALASIDGFFTRVQAFGTMAPSDPWRIHDIDGAVHAKDLALMEPGRGYWIYVTTAYTLSIVP